MARLSRVVINALSVVLAATAAMAQESGPSMTTTVATVRDRDVNGAQHVSEQVVTRTTRSTGSDEVVIETYLPTMYADRLTLRQRIRRVTTVTRDGSETVEETEETPQGSPHEPMRVVRRSVTTVRGIGSDSQQSEQRVFERDINGRLVPVKTQIDRATRR